MRRPLALSDASFGDRGSAESPLGDKLTTSLKSVICFP